MTIDILVAAQNKFDQILRDIHNASDVDLDVTHDAGVSIDDVVSIVAIFRNAIDDRPAWWKIRREVNAHFATHPEVTTRTLALIPEQVRDEIANFTADDINAISNRWLMQPDASPSDAQVAIDSLSSLVTACAKSRSDSKGVLLRTNQPQNAFELAFRQLEGKNLANYRKAFNKWDDARKYEAHQKYNYYSRQGLANSLALVLRDLTRSTTKKVNLKTDQRTVLRHIVKRVKEYCKAPNPSFGISEEPITLITLTFDIEYEGYVDLGFDTRPDAASDIRWEERTEDCLEFYHWNEGMQRVSCDELPLSITLHDGSKTIVSPGSDEGAFETYIGLMLRDTLLEARKSGELQKLPLADICYMMVGGTHANFAWPADGKFGAECLVNS